MLGRKNPELGKQLSEEVLGDLKKLIHEVYSGQIKATGSQVEVFAFTWPDEFLLTVSLRDPEQALKAPTTLFLSIDLNQEQTGEKVLHSATDLCGIFLDRFFENQEEDYVLRWTEEEHKKMTFHYKVTREDISATLKAEELLKNS